MTKFNYAAIAVAMVLAMTLGNSHIVIQMASAQQAQGQLLHAPPIPKEYQDKVQADQDRANQDTGTHFIIPVPKEQAQGMADEQVDMALEFCQPLADTAQQQGILNKKDDIMKSCVTQLIGRLEHNTGAMPILVALNAIQFCQEKAERQPGLDHHQIVLMRLNCQDETLSNIAASYKQ
jgi:hypothetical protein